MSFDPDKHHRRSIRLPGYDYAQSGAYFVTICVEGRRCIFGNVVNDEMILNDLGQTVHRVWEELPRYPGVEVDRFQVMPNHLHGIVGIHEAEVTGDGQARGPAPTGVQPTTLGLPDVVQRFKSFTTTMYRRQFAGPTDLTVLWQRNYFEHIIRSQWSLERIRQYIAENPARWHWDAENPAGVGGDDVEAWVRSLEQEDGQARGPAPTGKGRSA